MTGGLLAAEPDGEGGELQPCQSDAVDARRDASTWWGFCILWLAGNWAYQSILQAQAYYDSEMPGLGFMILMTFSWPLLGCHLVNILSGAAQAVGLKRRVYAAYIINALIGVGFILQDLVEVSIAVRRLIVMSLAALTALAQILLEPALFSLAALTQGSGAPTQAMMAGNAATGVIVWLASVGLRLAAGRKKPSVEAMRAIAHVFFSLLIVASCGCAWLFWHMLRRGLMRTSSSERLQQQQEQSTQQQEPLRQSQGQKPVAIEHGSGRCSSTVDGNRPDELSTASVAKRMCLAERYVRLPALCQFLVFWCTLAAWPSIPAAAALGGPFAQMGTDWWFLLVVGVYNVLDFAARLNLRRLQGFAESVSRRCTFLACCSRLLLVPLIYCCVKPQLLSSLGANILILAATSVLALTNGFLATASMMQASTAPAPLTEDGVNVAAIGIYLGLASGATTSLLIGRYAMGLKS